MTDSRPHHELHDIADLDPDGLPSRRSLLKASAIAIAMAAALLVVAILPAEYGIDPTGIGGKLGLTALNDARAVVESGPAEALVRSDTPFQTKTLTLSLMPGQGAEIKAVMAAGQSFVYEWAAQGGAVYVDMHGDRPNASEDDFTSFRIAQSLDRAAGSFRAPFTGRHGWYWQNKGELPVTIELRMSGFYQELYMP